VFGSTHHVRKFYPMPLHLYFHPYILHKRPIIPSCINIEASSLLIFLSKLMAFFRVILFLWKPHTVYSGFNLLLSNLKFGLIWRSLLQSDVYKSLGRFFGFDLLFLSQIEFRFVFQFL